MNQKLNQTLIKAIDLFIQEEGLDYSRYLDKESISSSNLGVGAFLQCVEDGLSERGSSLALLSTQMTHKISLPKEGRETRLVVDAGGTNLRIVEVKVYAEKDLPKIEQFKLYKMPGIKETISKDDFLNLLVDYIEPFIHNQKEIQLCFSYNINFVNGKAVVQDLAKEIRIDGLIGKAVCEELLQTLHARGFSQFERVVVLNDTVATLLAGKLVSDLKEESYDAYLGLVWGTGFNVAYEEWRGRQEVVNELPWILNSECGNYEGWPMAEFDKELDKLSAQLGKQLSEKKVSGYYLGDNFRLAVKCAIKNDYFKEFSNEEWDKDISKWMMLSHVSTSDLSGLLSEGEHTRTAFIKKYGILSDDFLSVLEHLGKVIVERATTVVAVVMTGLIIRSVGGIKSQKEFEKYKVLLNLDGSVVNKMPNVRENLESMIKGMLTSRGIKLTTISVENAPTLGSAVAKYS